MKVRTLTGVVLIISLLLMGCSTHVHTIGNGPQSNQSDAKTQWYILFGIIPLNDVDTSAMAGGATDYEITTQQTFIDGVISIFTGLVTINRRTVTVEK